MKHSFFSQTNVSALGLAHDLINTPLQRGVAPHDDINKPFQRFLSLACRRAAGNVRCAVVAASLLLTISASAQTYSIDWFKVAGGGGTSTGGVFTLSGTIGQHDAGGPLTGGSYSLTGGFWALFAVQTTNAPLLKITLTPTNTAVVHWPSPSTGWRLQQALTLVNPTWTTPTETVNDNGAEKYVVVSPPAGNRFYRLTMP